MRKRLSPFTFSAVSLVATSFVIAMMLNCNDPPTRPNPCWTSVDTLFSSGIPIRDTSDVRAAFDAYVTFVDSTDAEFPMDQNWSYLTSRPFHKWKGRFYWQVDHMVYSPDQGTMLLRRLVYVDENGVVVLPYGCI